MLYKRNSNFSELENQITPEGVYLNRRSFLKKSSQYSVGLFGGFVINPQFEPQDLERKVTEEKFATSYNNFYEFSLDKEEVQKKVAQWDLNIDKWRVKIDGECEKKGDFSLSQLIEMAGGKQEERVYRFRCVEAWSMVLPWGGFELAKLVQALKPNKKAKFLVFQTLKDPKSMPNIERLSYPWPYQEGLTLEEAQNSLSFLATGLYGKPLPKQNGAPLRLVVPWKYGFKSIKSIVKMSFVETQPKTLWNELAPQEYGFYANVNPSVDHPRWSQASERVIDGKLFPTRIKTLAFNGYDKEVASLYKSLDLKKYF
jgi:sulfoxide reductase catalytic subunit YedY